MAKKKAGKKNPWIAAALNFVWPGIGYLYVGKRSKFGALLAFGILMSVFVAIPMTGIALASALVLEFAFAYDAYQEAKS